MTTARDYFKSLFDNKKDKTNPINALYQKPIKDKGKESAHFQFVAPNYFQQADILTLPNDQGYNMCLVVSDQGSRRCDAEPLKEKSAESVFNAIKAIWNRNYVKQPKFLKCDSGTEFKGNFQKGVQEMGVQVSYAQPHRHRSLAIVERANQTIGSIIWKMINEHLLGTNKNSTKWVQFLPDLIDV